MRKAPTFGQLLREKRGGRASDDRAYDQQRRQQDPYLARAAQLRSSARWQAVRAAQLRRQPLCEPCEGRSQTTAAAQVDHIRGVVELLKEYVESTGLPVAMATPPGVFDGANLMSVCTSCHAAKSQHERRRGG